MNWDWVSTKVDLLLGSLYVRLTTTYWMFCFLVWCLRASVRV